MGNLIKGSNCCHYERNNQLEIIDNDNIYTIDNIISVTKLQAMFRGYLYRKIFYHLNNTNLISSFHRDRIPGIELDELFNIEELVTNPNVKELKSKFPPFEINEKELMQIKISNLKKFTIKYPDSSIYKGHFNKNWERQGFGLLLLSDGSLFEGFFRSNLMQGRGRLTSTEGFLFDGEFSENKANGFGKYLNMDGTVYTGHWKDEKQHGYGEETFHDGSQYQGNYIMGKKTGKGKFIWTDNYEYEGEFFNNDIHGFGTYRWKDGRIFKGQWVGNKMNGHGIFIWPDKKKYIGSYKNDLKDGYGIFYWPDNKKYEGCWLNGKQHGYGIFSETNYSDNLSKSSVMVKYGMWENGKKIKYFEDQNEINDIINVIRLKKNETMFEDIEKNLFC